MARKLKSINAYDTSDDLWDISCDKRKLLQKAFGVTPYDLYFDWPSSDYSSIDFQRMFLLSGYYGDFPPITISAECGHISKWLANVKGRLNRKVDIDGILELVVSTIPNIAPTKGEEHEDLYRVAHFATCIRNDVLAGYMTKRSVPWNPLVSFTRPFLYRKGKAKNWVMDNNIFKSEIIEFIHDVYFYLIAASVCPKSYDFLLLNYTKEDVERLGLFNCINHNKEVMLKSCELVDEMNTALILFDQSLREIAQQSEPTYVTPDNLFEVVQGMFKRLKLMESYVSSL